MGKVPALACLLLLVHHAHGGVPRPATSPAISPPRFSFQEKTGGGNYRVGQKAILKVRVTDDDLLEENDEWKFCRWERLRDGAYCKFTYECDGILCDIGVGNFYHTTFCSDDELSKRISFDGEDPNVHNRICGLQISSLTLADSSTWKVDVEQCRVTGCGSNNGNGNIISTSLNVKVK